jgi:hypothetical protein
VLSYDLVIWNHPPRATPAHASECWRVIHAGNRKDRGEGGEPFSTGKAVGGPKSYDSKETVVLYMTVVLYITYYTPFSALVVQWKEIFFCSLHKMMETGELFVVYGECDEDRSSEAAMVEGRGARSAPLCKLVSSKRRVRTAHGRARAAKTH